MAVEYVIKQKVNPKDPTGTRKFYAIAVSTGEETPRDIATEISKRTNLSVADVYSALEAFLDLVPELLSKGRIVRLGELGSFRTSISSKGTATKEEFNSSNITEASVIFQPGKLVQKVIQTLDYKKAEE